MRIKVSFRNFNKILMNHVLSLWFIIYYAEFRVFMRNTAKTTLQIWTIPLL